VLHDKKYVSIPKDNDPYTITPEKAVELIEAKRVADANRTIKLFAEDPDMQVLNGRFGPYIKAGKKNVKIPKGKVPAELTYEECVTLAAAAPERRGRWGREEQQRRRRPMQISPLLKPNPQRRQPQKKQPPRK
jgi:DNA topoisomerase I